MVGRPERGGCARPAAPPCSTPSPCKTCHERPCGIPPQVRGDTSVHSLNEGPEKGWRNNPKLGRDSSPADCVASAAAAEGDDGSVRVKLNGCTQRRRLSVPARVCKAHCMVGTRGPVEIAGERACQGTGHEASRHITVAMPRAPPSGFHSAVGRGQSERVLTGKEPRAQRLPHRRARACTSRR